jgi:hypothetical protein
VSKILNIEWLEQSSRQQQLLDTDDFLHLHDVEAEKRYNFSMKETIQNGIIARREGGVFGGKGVYICRGVAGNQAPSAKELQLIIEAAGGSLLKSLDGSTDIDATNTIILTSDPKTQSQLNEHGVEEFMNNGARAYTTSWLFHSIITQSLAGFNCNRGTRRRDQAPSKIKSPQVSSLVRCNSHESLVSTLTASPVKRHPGRKRNVNKTSDGSICSGSSRGSKVTHLEYADNGLSPRKRLKTETEPNMTKETVSQPCRRFLSREQFLSEFSPSTEPFTKDTATIKTHTLWLDYFKKFGAKSPLQKAVSRVGKGVRCRRGRKQSLSPLVTCTLGAEVDLPSATPRSNNKTRHKPPNLPSTTSSLPEHHEHISWEAYVLFTLGSRAGNLDRRRDSMHSKSPQPKATSLNLHQLAIHRTNCLSRLAYLKQRTMR